MVTSGTYSRLAIGVIIFTHVIAYNESGAITVLFSAFIATVCATFSGKSISLYAFFFKHFMLFGSKGTKYTQIQ